MSGNEIRCYVVDKVTGRVVSEHGTIQEASEKLGRRSSCSRQARNRCLLSSSRYTIRLVDDYDPHERYGEGQYGVPVVASRGNVVKVFHDREAAAEFLHVATSTLSILITRGRCTDSGWSVRKLPHMGALNEALGLEA